MTSLQFLLTVHGFVFMLGWLVSLLAVRLSIGLARQHEVLARPSTRGSHNVSTPRLGGLGLAVGFASGCVFIQRLTGDYGVASPWIWAMYIGAAWALVGGLLDDVLDLPAANKFLFQAAAAVAMAQMGGVVAQLSIPGLGLIEFPPLYGFLLTVLIVIFWINAFNFMDGSDGHAAGFALWVCLVTASFLYLPGLLSGGPVIRQLVDSWTAGHPVSLFLALTAGCSAGLLMHNHPRVMIVKKTFMGDGGSHFLGLVMAALIIAAAQVPGRPGRTPQVPLLASFLVLLPFIYDVVFTLLRRLLRGENILTAHRGHLYQRLLVAGWSHGQVLLLNSLIWLLCSMLAFAYLLGERGPVGQPFDQWMAIILGLFVMVAYTFGVHLVEQSAIAKQAQNKSH